MPEESIEVRVDTKRLQEAMEHVPGRLYAGLRTVFSDRTRDFLKRFRTDNLRASKSGHGVQSRSRNLSNSFHREVRGDSLGNLEAEVFSAGNPYARIHELGGTITPKKASYLTIPLKGARQGDRAGATARASARHFQNTFFLRTRAGKLLLMGSPTEGRSNEIVPLFLLVKSVTLKPRLGFRKLWDEMEPGFIRQVNRAVDAALAGGAA